MILKYNSQLLKEKILIRKCKNLKKFSPAWKEVEENIIIALQKNYTGIVATSSGV